MLLCSATFRPAVASVRFPILILYRIEESNYLEELYSRNVAFRKELFRSVPKLQTYFGEAVM